VEVGLVDKWEARGRQQADEKWQNIVADKDAEIARLREQLQNRG